VLWLTLRFTGMVGRLLDQAGIELVTRISGLLLTAIAVQLVADGIREFIEKASDVPSGFGRRLPGALARSPPAWRIACREGPKAALMDDVLW
jgi:hypothetical protein